MTTTTVPAKTVQELAVEAQGTYETKAKGFPEVSENRIAEAKEIYETRRVGPLGASEKQRADALRLLTEQNTRAGFLRLAERAKYLSEFALFAKFTGSGVINLSYDDWLFLARAADVKESDIR